MRFTKFVGVALVAMLGLVFIGTTPKSAAAEEPYKAQIDALRKAMQAGAAPVITQVDGLPEDVIDGQSALLVEPNSVTALAAALRRFLTDSTLRRRVAAEAHKQYLKRFSAGAFALDLRRIYTALGFASKEPR